MGEWSGAEAVPDWSGAEPVKGIPKQIAPWAGHILAAAHSTRPDDVDEGQWGSFIAGVLDRETGGRNITGADMHGHGLMQIDDRYHDFANTPDVFDPAKNVAYGAGYLRDLFQKLPPGMPLDERLQRAADAFNAGPPHLKAAEPDSGTTGGDYGQDVLRRAKGIDLSHIAFTATATDPQAAAQKLAQQGTPEQAKAESIKVSLASAPITAAYMAQSPEHAAVVGQNADSFSWWERWFFGTTKLAPVPAEAVGPYADALRKQGGMPVTDVPPVVVTALARGGAALRAEWEGFRLFLQEKAQDATNVPDIGQFLQLAGSPHAGPLLFAGPRQDSSTVDEQKQRVKMWQDVADNLPTPSEGQSAQFPQRAIRMGVGQLPFFAAAPAGGLGTFAVLTAQSIGHLTAKGVDPDRAAVGGVIAGAAGAIAGDKLLELLAPAARALGVSRLVADVPAALLSAQGALAAGLKFGRRLLHGLAMQTSISASERVTEVWDGASKEGRKADPSEYALAVGGAIDDAVHALPLIGLFGGLGLVGEFMEAHGNAAAHDAITGPARDLKVPDAQAKELLRSVLEQRAAVERMRVEQAGLNADVHAEAIRRAEAPLTRWIEADEFARVMREKGRDPIDMAASLAGDGGEAFREAQATGGKFPVPTEKYIIDLREFHDDLRSAVAGDADGATLSKRGGKWLSEEYARELYGKTEGEGGGRGAPIAADMTPEQKARLERLFQAAPAKTPAASPRAAERAAKATEQSADLNAPPQYGSPFARKVFVDMQLRARSIDELRQAKYMPRVNEANREIARGTESAINKLASAEQTAQEGVDKAVAGLDQIRQGIGSLGKQQDAVLTEAFQDAAQHMRDMAERGAPVTRIEALRYALSKLTASSFLRKTEAPDATAAARTALQGQIAAERARLLASLQAKDKSVSATEQSVAAGDDLQAVERAKEKRALNQAFEKARLDILARSAKEIDGLKGAADERTRAAVYDPKASGHPEYGWGYDLIMESAGLREPDSSYRPTDFNEVARTLIDNGDKLEFDAEAIRDLVARPRPTGKLTLDELANARRAVDNLRALASARVTADYEGKRQSIQEVVAKDIAPTVAKLASTQRQPLRRLSGAIIDRVAGENATERLDRAYHDFHTVLYQLGKWGNEQEFRFVVQRHGENALLAEWGKLIETATKQSKDLVRLGDLDVPTPEWMPAEAKDLYGPTMKRRDLWVALMRSGSEEGMAALARGWRTTPEQATKWLHSVVNDPAEWGLLKSWWKNAEGMGQRELEADARRGGVPMILKTPRQILAPTGESVTGGYAPERWYRAAVPAEASVNDTEYGIRAMQDVAHGHTIATVEHPLVPDLRWDRLAGHIRALAKDIALGDFVRDQASMLNSPEFRQAVKPLGPDYYRSLVQWHNTVASGQVQYATDPMARHAVLEAARGYTARIVFNLNHKVAGGIVGHIPFAKATLNGDLDLTTGLRKAMFDSQARAAAKEQPAVADRYVRWRQRLLEAERVMVGKAPGDTWLSYLGHNIFHVADIAMTQVVYHGVESEMLSRGKTSAEAQREANIQVSRLMPPIDIYDRAPIDFNRVVALVVLAKNFEHVVQNVNARSEIDARWDVADGRSWPMMAYTARRLAVAGSLALGHYLFLGHGRNEQEQRNGWVGWGQYLGRSMLTAYNYGNYLAHMVASDIGQVLVGEKLDVHNKLMEIPEALQARNFINDFGHMIRAAMGRGSPSKAVAAGLDAAGRLLGAHQVEKSAVGAFRSAKYAIFDQSDFKGGIPQTPLGYGGKIWFGDVDRHESNVFSDSDRAAAALFDSLWRGKP